jgi:hypothetical protein
MIVVGPFFDRVGVSTALGGNTALQPAHLELLEAELEEPEYEGLTRAQILVKLNEEPVIDNPELQGRVPRTVVPQAEYVVLINRIVLRGDQLTGAAADIWKQVKSAAEGMRFQASVNLADPDVQQGVSALTQLGLLSLREGEEVSLGDLLTTVPDPSYLSRVIRPSVAAQITGIAGAVFTHSDLDGLI